MKPVLICAALACGLTFCSDAAPETVAPQMENTSSHHAQTLHFMRGTTNLSVRDVLDKGKNRFYTLKIKAGQLLNISVRSASASQVVPLVFVTPPGGKFNGDKTSSYAEDSSRAGIYKIEVATNQMASQAQKGAFVLEVSAR